MKASITSTNQVVEMKDLQGRAYTARVWEGESEGGVKFTAYIPTVQVARDADNSVFERELSEHVAPRADTMRAIDMRFVL
ncbi:MAG: hypothetical protein Q7S17_05745 [Xanthobacteraceae bacterium]|nr:hypothetical protein [Xanthobacteraceae bacterium]